MTHHKKVNKPEYYISLAPFIITLNKLVKLIFLSLNPTSATSFFQRSFAFLLHRGIKKSTRHELPQFFVFPHLHLDLPVFLHMLFYILTISKGKKKDGFRRN